MELRILPVGSQRGRWGALVGPYLTGGEVSNGTYYQVQNVSIMKICAECEGLHN